MFSTKKEDQISRLEKLAKLHDMQVPESLDMNHWFVDSYGEEVSIQEGAHGCATPSCSLGWAIFSQEDLRNAIVEASNGCKSIYQVVSHYFGISYRDATASGRLFGTEERTPAEQAAVIREVIQELKEK